MAQGRSAPSGAPAAAPAPAPAAPAPRAAAPQPARQAPAARGAPNGAAPTKAPPPAAAHHAATPLTDLDGPPAGDPDDPETLRKQIAFAEFQNLAVMHHKLVERVALLEKEVFRLRRDLKAAGVGAAKPAAGRTKK